MSVERIAQEHLTDELCIPGVEEAIRTSAGAIALAENCEQEAIPTTFMWLEITGNCNEECNHCYAESGPKSTHGTMNESDWKRVIDEGVEQGVEMVQFIGGEPTLHPSLPQLIDHALEQRIEVEVFSNLSHITPQMWDKFTQPGVRLATSYYSPNPAEHEAITQARGSHKRTRQNISEAVRRGIPLRAGIIGVHPGQDVEGAIIDLLECGVDPDKIGVDYIRQVGRGVRDREESVKELCGNCADGVLAVMPDGTVSPCVFSRWIDTGNVQDASLDTVVASDAFTGARAILQQEFKRRQSEKDASLCFPNCSPQVPPPCEPDDFAPRPTFISAPELARTILAQNALHEKSRD